MTIHQTIVCERLLDAAPAEVYVAYADAHERARWSAPSPAETVIYEESSFGVGGIDRYRCGAKANLLIARILVRRSHITEAADLLAIVGDRGSRASLRWLLLAGEVAQRRGRLRDAEDFFRRAQEEAATDAERLHAALARGFS